MASALVGRAREGRARPGPEAAACAAGGGGRRALSRPRARPPQQSTRVSLCNLKRVRRRSFLPRRVDGLASAWAACRATLHPPAAEHAGEVERRVPRASDRLPTAAAAAAMAHAVTHTAAAAFLLLCAVALPTSS